MKVFFLTLIISTSAFADVPTFSRYSATCSEIQDAVKMYGSINFVQKVLIGHRTLNVFPNELNCGRGFYYSAKLKETMSDGVKCMVGYYCEFDGGSND